MIRVFVLSALAVLIGLVTTGLLLARSPGQVEHQVFYGGQILLPRAKPPLMRLSMPLRQQAVARIAWNTSP